MNNPNSTIAWLFPGQGSQEVGMGAKLFQKHPAAREIIRLAEDYAGTNLTHLMARGPDAELSRTEISQPALVGLSCAYIDLLRESGIEPAFVAGHSLGELPALYASRVLLLSDVLRLAAVRGQLMSRDAVGGMAAIKSCDLENLTSLISTIDTGTVCIANLNAPTQIVVSGDEVGLSALLIGVKTAGGSAVRLNVGGAWHSPLVAVAAHAFEQELRLTKFADPACQVVLSSTAKLSSSGEEIRSALIRQMTSPVRWYETIGVLVGLGCNEFYEVGSGRVLKGLMRRIVPTHFRYDFHSMEQGSIIDKLVAQTCLSSAKEEVR